MKAIILAAGKSTRLYPITLENPKCMLQVGDKKIIDHQISWLRQCNVTNILVVTGYLNHMIESHLIDSYLNEDVRFIHYPNYENTNNLATLYSVRDKLNDDVVILFSDVLLSVNLLYRCINSSDNICLIVDPKNITDKTMRVVIHDDFIADIGGHIPVEQADANFIGVAKFSVDAAHDLVVKMGELLRDDTCLHDYYTIALRDFSAFDSKVSYIEVDQDPWVEIDTVEDYRLIQLDGIDLPSLL